MPPSFKTELRWSLVGITLVCLYLIYHTRQYSQSASPTPLPMNSSTAIILDLATIQGHNTPADCWIIINHQVYAVSAYLSAHPGGTRTITGYCGNDATTAFNTKGSLGRTHSAIAESLLKKFLLGEMGTTTTTVTSQQSFKGGDYDDD